MASITSSPSIMEALPLEIVHLVMSFLPTEDLNNWRLSSKECAKAGERHIVRDLHVMYTAKSFANLLNISRHPSLSKYVQSIVYEARYLVEVDQTGFEQNILDGDEYAFENPENITADTKAILSPAWTAYRRMLDEQQYIKKTGYDVSVFSQALVRLPALKRAEVISEYKNRSEALERAYEATMAVSGFLLECGELSDEGNLTRIRALRTVLLATTGMQSGLEDLHVHLIHWSFFSSAPLSLHFPAYVNLRHLDLEFEADPGDKKDQEVVEARHVELGLALRSATGLETLRLVFEKPDTLFRWVRVSDLVNAPVVWERITGDTTWPKLRSLELQVATCSEADIMRFFTRHARTLRSVSLVNMWLTDCTTGWSGVFKMMKHSLKLEEVHLGGCWGQDGAKGQRKLIQVEGKVGARVSKALTGLGNSDNLESSIEDAVAESPFMLLIA